MNKTQWYVNSLIKSELSPLPWKEQSTLFPESTIVSDLEIVILISTASHSASKHTCVSWKVCRAGAHPLISHFKNRVISLVCQSKGSFLTFHVTLTCVIDISATTNERRPFGPSGFLGGNSATDLNLAGFCQFQISESRVLHSPFRETILHSSYNVRRSSFSDPN